MNIIKKKKAVISWYDKNRVVCFAVFALLYSYFPSITHSAPVSHAPKGNSFLLDGIS